MPQQGRPSAGDMTGRTKATQQKAAREEQASRAAEISMQDGADQAAERDGVFDPQSGEQIDGGPPPAQVAKVVTPQPRVDRFNRPEEVVLTGQEDPETVEPLIAARKAFTPPPVEIVRSSRVRIRVDADIEDMTYGMFNGEPNNYTFREGLTYEVPLEVAEHLNDRGLVRQWITK